MNNLYNNYTIDPRFLASSYNPIGNVSQLIFQNPLRNFMFKAGIAGAVPMILDNHLNEQIKQQSRDRLQKQRELDNRLRTRQMYLQNPSVGNFNEFIDWNMPLPVPRVEYPNTSGYQFNLPYLGE